jgi:glucose-1-phosphate thymidylyltransferase
MYACTMKGVVLAGGTGSRLSPITKGVSKQLLPIYNKPLIYYPIATLMLTGIREILIITTRHDSSRFKETLASGEQWGIKIAYDFQDKPLGLAQGILIAENFIGTDPFALILGDNLFHGDALGESLHNVEFKKQAHIFAYEVTESNRYGVIELDSSGNPLSIEEKPEFPKSKLAVTGLYFYQNTAIEMAKTLKPSLRGELEITDLNKLFLDQQELGVTLLPSGTAWFDAGTFESLYDASAYVKILEERQGRRIGDPMTIATDFGWV